MNKKRIKADKNTPPNHFEGLMNDFSEYLKLHQRAENKHQKTIKKLESVRSQSAEKKVTNHRDRLHVATDHTQKAQQLMDKIEDLVKLVENHTTNQAI